MKPTPRPQQLGPLHWLESPAPCASSKATCAPSPACRWAGPGFHTPAVVVGLLGQGTGPTCRRRVSTKRSPMPGSRCTSMARPNAAPGRKMGHFTVTAPTVAEARIKARPRYTCKPARSRIHRRRRSLIQVGIMHEGATPTCRSWPRLRPCSGSWASRPRPPSSPRTRTPRRLVEYAEGARSRASRSSSPRAGWRGAPAAACVAEPYRSARHRSSHPNQGVPRARQPSEHRADAGRHSRGHRGRGRRQERRVCWLPGCWPPSTARSPNGCRAYAAGLEAEVLAKAALLEAVGPEAYLKEGGAR